MSAGVVPPKVAYPHVHIITMDANDAAYMVRCEDCDGQFHAGEQVAMAWGRGRMHIRYMHHGCYHNGAPWRREAAERAKEGAK